MDNYDMITRRAALRGLGALMGTVAGSGFDGAQAQILKCANACQSVIDDGDRWAAGLPIIDAHCHIFNARDIPAVRFVTNVFLPSYALDLSPGNRKILQREIAELLSGMLGSTPGYEQERALLEARLAGEPVPPGLKASVLPAFAHGGKRTCYGRDVADNVTAVGNLLEILSEFRHRNFEALSATYETGLEGVSVALYTPAMVDMDYWLTADREPADAIGDVGDDAFSLPQTTVAQQIELMEMTQKLNPGRVHGFVSFCPWRQADDVHHNAHVAEGAVRRRVTALELVEDAVLNRGFIGVKLYPPMGFLPTGNAELPVAAFPNWAAEMPYADIFGTALDEAMRELFRFCTAHDVPVMAHCAQTNGAGSFTPGGGSEAESYAQRAHPFGWARVLAEPEFSSLRLNLAHFGASWDAKTQREWRAVIGGMMDAYPHVYADLSHYAEILLDNFTGSGQHCREAAEALDPLRKGFLARPAGDRRVNRLLYGSDWSMLSKEFYYGDYLRVAANMYRRKIYGMGRGAEKNAQGFLSGNAVRFMGLGKGEKTRTRLEAWYAKHGLDPAPLARFDAAAG